MTSDGATAFSSQLNFYRFLTLFCLCFSDGTYTVLRRYSRGVLHETFNVNEVLLGSEIIKLIFSIYMVSGSKTVDGLSAHLMDLISKSKKMLILAFIYGIGNLLSYYALARVGAGTFVVFAQGKTLTTAMFASLMLGQQYSWTKVRSLLTLVGGVILFVLPTLPHNDSTDDATGSQILDAINGCLAQGVAILLSGFASIYFEKAIKNDVATEGLDIWARNFQLGFHSILIYLLLLVGNPMSHSTGAPLLANWTPLAFVLSVLGACGGLLVALSIKYGDSVMKTLAISGSIIYAAIVDRLFLGGPLTGQMCISAGVVVLAIISYTFDPTPTPDLPEYPIKPKSSVDKATDEEECLPIIPHR